MDELTSWCEVVYVSLNGVLFFKFTWCTNTFHAQEMSPYIISHARGVKRAATRGLPSPTRLLASCKELDDGISDIPMYVSFNFDFNFNCGFLTKLFETKISANFDELVFN